MAERELPITRAMKGVSERTLSFIGFNTSGYYAIDPLCTPELIGGIKDLDGLSGRLAAVMIGRFRSLYVFLALPHSSIIEPLYRISCL
jgi:hypothetical protein